MYHMTFNFFFKVAKLTQYDLSGISLFLNYRSTINIVSEWVRSSVTPCSNIEDVIVIYLISVVLRYAEKA